MSQPREREKHSALRSELGRSLALASLAGAGMLLILDGPGQGMIALVAWAFYAAIVYRAAVRAGLPGFGWAHRVTLLRGLLMALLVPALLAPERRPWLPLLLGGTALVLDGIDGPIARRTRSASAFGARFDMETDALTVLMLSALVAAQGQVGLWVLTSGALRYLYVAAGWVWPWLRRPVPPSFARKLVCALQIAGLLAALTPILPQPWPAAIAAASLALLIWSFGRDVLGLMRGKGMAESPAAPYLPYEGSV